MITFNSAKTNSDFKIISKLARQIWTEHYTPIIGINQVNYMLEKFQSEKAIEIQIKNDNYFYYIIINQNRPIGYLSIKIINKALFLSKIYINKASRGKGIGKTAMHFIEEQAVNFNCNKIYLTVNKFNTNSIKAYEKIGFIKTEELVMDIGHGYVMDDFKMEKRL